MPLPTVNARDLNLANLAPGVRKELRRRANEAARREYAPQLQAARAGFDAPRQAYQTQAAATRGAAQMTEDVLLNALAGLNARGLQGSALRQTRDELNARVGDAASSIPYLLADAAEERAAGLSEARQNLMQTRADMQTSAASKFNSLLKEEEGAASTVIGNRRKARRQEEEEAEGGGLELSPESIQNAKLALRDALGKWRENPMIETEDGEEMSLREYKPLETEEDWRNFGVELEREYEGFGLAEINAVIQEVLRRREQKQPLEGAAKGVYSSPFN